MSNITWNLEDRVRFEWDGLVGSGIICQIDDYMTTVCLDNQNKGWKMGIYDIDPSIFSRYKNKQGWHVPTTHLKHAKTKLGNIL